MNWSASDQYFPLSPVTITEVIAKVFLVPSSLISAVVNKSKLFHKMKSGIHLV